jgi:hypothetical protein
MSDRAGGGERVYRRLLGLYPAEFRQRFGEDMVQLFHDRLHEARSRHMAGGALVAWTRVLADLVVTAPTEYLRRHGTVAHSLATQPSITTRLLGAAGIVAGLAILAAFLIDLPSGLFRDRLLVFSIGVSAIAIGVHSRQSARAPGMSLVLTTALVAANVFFLISVLFLQPPNPAALWAGLALWLVSALFGAGSALLGAVNRVGGWAVAVGSLLTITGIDRLGLVSEASPTVFNTASQVGIAVMAVGWIVLGLDVALRRVAPQGTG